MNDIHPGMEAAVSLFILCRQNQKGDRGRVEHFGKTGDAGDSGNRHAIEFIVGQPQPVLDEVFELAPQRRTPVANHDIGTNAVGSLFRFPESADMGGCFADRVLKKIQTVFGHSRRKAYRQKALVRSHPGTL